MSKSIEGLHQAAVMEWVNVIGIQKYHELELLYHIPNGGKRNKLIAVQLKKEGVKAGVLDLHLPVARGGYHSLYIEMKIKPNKLTTKQATFKKLAEDQGNRCEVCYSMNEAIAMLQEYLSS